MGIGTPFYRNGKKVGVLIGYVWLKKIADILNQYHFTQNSHAFLLNSDGLVSAHPDSEIAMKTFYGVPDEKDADAVAFYESIEAARAGSAGKGFSVVAEEIRKLADNCRITAGKIQSISETVTDAVIRLNRDAEDLLKYIDISVLKDYGFFSEIAEHYYKDATALLLEISKNPVISRFFGHEGGVTTPLLHQRVSM